MTSNFSDGEVDYFILNTIGYLYPKQKKHIKTKSSYTSLDYNV